MGLGLGMSLGLTERASMKCKSGQGETCRRVDTRVSRSGVLLVPPEWRAESSQRLCAHGKTSFEEGGRICTHFTALRPGPQGTYLQPQDCTCFLRAHCIRCPGRFRLRNAMIHADLAHGNTSLTRLTCERKAAELKDVPLITGWVLVGFPTLGMVRR